MIRLSSSLLARLLTLLLVLLMATPAEAQRRKRGFPETPSAEGKALFDLRSGFDRLSTGDTRGAVELLSRAIESEALPPQAAGSAYFFRGAAYREQSKFAESLADLEKAGTLTPEKGQIPVLAFDVALRMDRPQLAYDKALLVASKFPGDISSLDLTAINAVITSLENGRRFDDTQKLRAALFEAGYQGSPAGETADYLFRDLVNGYLKREDLVNAIRVSSAITTVDVLVAMLVDARYQELWPSIETAMGGGFAKAAQRQRQRYSEIVKELPEDGQAVNMLVESLRLTGEAGEAATAGAKLLDDPVALGRDPEAYFWVLVKTAAADVESGNADKGLKRLAELASFRLDDYPDLVNHHLNRAALLLDQGRFDEAVAAAKLADSRYLSRYGKLWIKTFETCALAQTADKKDPTLAAALDALKDGSGDNPSGYALALLCANRMNEAEAWYVRRLGKEEWREVALRALQQYRQGSNEGEYYAALQQRLDLIRRRSAIKKAIARVGRQLAIDLPRNVVAEY